MMWSFLHLNFFFNLILFKINNFFQTVAVENLNLILMGWFCHCRGRFDYIKFFKALSKNSTVIFKQKYETHDIIDSLRNISYEKKNSRKIFIWRIF